MPHRLTSITIQTELRAIRDAGEILPLTADEIPYWLSLAVPRRRHHDLKSLQRFWPPLFYYGWLLN